VLTVASLLFSSSLVSAASPAAPSAEPECRIDRAAPVVRLHGSMKDPTGAAIAGAKALFRCGNLTQQAVAAADGTYLVTIPPGNYTADISASGFGSVSQSVTVGTVNPEQSFTLPIGTVNSIVSVSAPGAYVATSATTATKSAATLIETPQSVSVITTEQMNERNVQTINQAVEFTPGVGVSTYGNESRFDWVNIRGFDESTYGLFRDNSRWQTGQISGQIDPYLIQEIDVIKGPSSVLYGQNTPGGLINVVTKRPGPEPSNELMVSFGSFERKQVQADFTGPFDSKQHFRYRLTGLFRDSDTQVRYVPDDRRMIAPAFTWAPSDRTTLTVLGDYQHDNTGWGQFLPSQGVLTSNPNGRIPTDFFTGEPGYDYFRRQQWSAGYLFEHRFSEAWTIRQTARYSKISFHGNDVFGGGLADDLRTLNRFGFGNSLNQDLYTTDTQAFSRFRTKTLEHSVLFGVDYSKSDSTIVSGFASAPPIDVFNPVYAATIPALFTYYNTNQPSWQTGAYAQDHLKIGKIVATLSGREDFTNMKTRDRIANTVVEQSPGKFTGRAGITYVSDRGIAPYFSYSTSFLPTAGVNFFGQPFKPTTGEQYEAGVKYQPRHMNSFITASVFNIRQNNVQTIDPGNPLNTLQTGEVRSRGVELEGVASLLEGLDLHASYSYIDEEITKSNDSTLLGKRPTLIPDRLFGLAGDYTLTRGPLAGLGIGLGTRFVGTTAGDSTNTLILPTYTLMEGSLRYTWRNLQFQLSGTNLLDKVYVPVCTSISYCNYGSRRNVIGSVRYRWNAWMKK